MNSVTNKARRILLAVTIDDSLQFIEGFPEQLIEQGWSVTVVSGPGPRLTKFAMDGKFHTHALAMERNPSPFKDLLAGIRWFRLLKSVRPDVVYIGTPKASLLGLTISKVLRIPKRIYVLHGLRLETATGMGALVLRQIEKITMCSATEVQAVSASLKDQVVRKKLVRPNKIFVIGQGSCNGVDASSFARHNQSPKEMRELRERLNIDSRKIVIGFVGRITRDKGIPDLVASIKNLENEKLPVQLLLVGEIDSRRDEELLELIDQAGIDCVRTGYVSDPRPYYHLMDIFCLPSYREGFPTVSLEASASGLPIVTSDATGARDAIFPSGNGLVFRTGEVLDLTKKLRTLVEDQGLRKRFGKAGHEWVLKNFARSEVQAALLRRIEL